LAGESHPTTWASTSPAFYIGDTLFEAARSLARLIIITTDQNLQTTPTRVR
jgi:rRNA-processing protein FCF1